MFSNLFSSFNVNNDSVLLRFGELSVMTERSEIDNVIAGILWKHEKLTYFLHQLGLYHELSDQYGTLLKVS